MEGVTLKLLTTFSTSGPACTAFLALVEGWSLTTFRWPAASRQWSTVNWTVPVCGWRSVATTRVAPSLGVAACGEGSGLGSLSFAACRGASR